VINAIKIKLQFTTDEVQSDSLIVKEVLEGNDNLVRDTTLQLLCDNLLSVGKSPVELKRLGETKYPTAKLAKTEDV
jgi:hypothetical protein